MSLSHWNMAVAGFFVGIVIGWCMACASWDNTITAIEKSGFMRGADNTPYRLVPLQREPAK